MFKTNLKRIIKSGYLSFRRNSWLSAATIMIMVMTLFVTGGLVFLSAFAGTVIKSLESKIDVSVYFLPEAPEQHILAVQKEIENLSDVAEVTYVTKEQALAEFRERHKDNALIMSALSEVGDNPLEASLNVRAKDPSNYASISEFLLRKNYPVVDKINYFENQKVIERFASILRTMRSSGALVLIFLAIAAVLVAFNTVRLAIYTLREEVGIMRLVGANNWFVRGPFMVAGVFYGVISSLIVVLLFFPVTWLIAPRLELLFPGFDLFKYFLGNFWQFSGIMLGIGIGMGVISSYIAIRKYLQV